MGASLALADKRSQSLGKPIPVVVVSGNAFKLDEIALSRILLDPRVKDRSVVVVSVAGAFRKGKSFLLDFFLRYLNAPNDPNWLGDEDSPLKGFSWRGGSERDTSGILMWSEPFIIERGDEEVAVLLMDTQGSFDSQSTVKECAIVFALSTLLSSVQVYNLSTQIQENDLQYLQYFTEYGRLALESNCNYRRSGEKPFQALQFLVRDWPYPYEYSFGKKGGNEYLEKILQVSNKQQSELKQLRNHIRSCFQSIDCYLMPHPGDKVTTNRTFDGRLKDIEPEFQTSLKSYVELMLDPKNLVEKKIYGSHVTGEQLVAYFKTYMDLFQGDKLPKPMTVFQATAKANHFIAVNEARKVYSEKMEVVCAPGKPYLEPKDLEYRHDRSARMARNSFNQARKMGGLEFTQRYARKLEEDLKRLYQNYVKLNERKMQWSGIMDTVSNVASIVVPAIGLILWAILRR